MKKAQILAFAVSSALTTTSVAQHFPSCAWNDCMTAWSVTECTAATNSGWSCLCSNATAIAQINTCVATSCTNVTDQEAIYGAIAQLCANDGITETASQEATFSATSGGSAWPTVTGGGGWGPGGQWNSGAWSSWISACSSAIGAAPSNWTGGPWGGWGDHGSSRWAGPYGTKASGVNCASWTTWTAGWGPHSSWTGLWSGCSSTTATPSPATVTMTITTNGVASVITGTTFGVQAQAVSATSGSTNAAASVDALQVGVLGGAAAVVFGVMVAL